MRLSPAGLHTTVEWPAKDTDKGGTLRATTSARFPEVTLPAQRTGISNWGWNREYPQLVAYATS